MARGFSLTTEGEFSLWALCPVWFLPREGRASARPRAYARLLEVTGYKLPLTVYCLQFTGPASASPCTPASLSSPRRAPPRANPCAPRATALACRTAGTRAQLCPTSQTGPTGPTVPGSASFRGSARPPGAPCMEIWTAAASDIPREAALNTDGPEQPDITCVI